jgi:hypothetical protein
MLHRSVRRGENSFFALKKTKRPGKLHLLSTMEVSPMRPRPVRLAALSLAACALTVTATAVLVGRPRPPDPSGWDEARLAAELQALGYHTHLESADRDLGLGPDGRHHYVLAGLYLCHHEPPDWEWCASRGRQHPCGWRGCAVVVRGGRGAPPGDPGCLAAGPWLFLGDPAELDRIAGALGVPR